MTHLKTKTIVMKAYLLFPIMLLLLAACQEEQGVAPADEMIAYRAAFPDDIALPTGFQPEGITVGKGHTAYVGSGFSGAIYQLDLRSGEGSYLVPPAMGQWVLGMDYDVRTGYLYAAGGIFGNLMVYEASTGELVANYQLTTPPMPGQDPTTLLNDVVVTRNGVYVTDSFSPFLYKLSLGAGGKLIPGASPQALLLSGDFQMVPDAPLGFPVNANGIDATPDGKYLVIVNLSAGVLYRVDPATGYADLIDLGGESMLFGDGLLLEPGDDGYTLYVVRNMLNMISEVQLEKDLLSGTVRRMITSPLLRIPSTVDDFGNGLYLVNARFDMAPPAMPAPDVEFNVVRIAK